MLKSVVRVSGQQRGGAEDMQLKEPLSCDFTPGAGELGSGQGQHSYTGCLRQEQRLFLLGGG